MSEAKGFTFSATKNDVVIIHHHGRKATTLKDKKAAQFLEFARTASESEQQIRMAKLTGNYKRGNERSNPSPGKKQK